MYEYTPIILFLGFGMLIAVGIKETIASGRRMQERNEIFEREAKALEKIATLIEDGLKEAKE